MKKLLAILLMIILSVAIFGCGPKKQATDDETQDKETNGTTSVIKDRGDALDAAAGE